MLSAGFMKTAATGVQKGISMSITYARLRAECFAKMKGLRFEVIGLRWVTSGLDCTLGKLVRNF